jgi:hypothetical protein
MKPSALIWFHTWLYSEYYKIFSRSDFCYHSKVCHARRGRILRIWNILYKKFTQTIHKFVANINRTILPSGKLKEKITTEFLKWDLVLLTLHIKIRSIPVHSLTASKCLCTISSLLIRCVVLFTSCISVLRWLDQSLRTSFGSLLCVKLTTPAGRSVLARTVLFTTRFDKKSSVSWNNNSTI